MEAAVVDDAGHLHMGYWKGNDALKGEEIPHDIDGAQLVSPSTTGSLFLSKGDVLLKAPSLPQVRWITPNEPNIAVALLDVLLDLEKGHVIEGTFQVEASDTLIFPAIGVCLEEKDQRGTAVLFETWSQTEIGTLYWSDHPRFVSRDRTGFGCATVAGVPCRETCSYRFLIREGIFEIYLNDLLVQTFWAKDLTGRIGFIVHDAEGIFSPPRVWKMSL